MRHITLFYVCILCILLSVTCAPKVDATTLKGKVMFGYQGWFNTPNDISKVGWRHWSNDTDVLNPSTVKVDMWPDTTEYNQSLLYRTKYHFPNGTAAKLFSSQYPSTIDLHFKWLSDYNLDGFFLQRFLSEIEDDAFFQSRNRAIKYCIRSSLKWGRTFAMMYDVSGIDSANLVKSLRKDWEYITGKLGVTKSPRYLQQDGKPVVIIWALGYNGRDDTPQNAIDIANYFKSKGCFVIAGVPITWRYGSGESRPGFDDAFLQFDGLTPWSIGRYFDESSFLGQYNYFTVGDQNYTQTFNKWYAPTIFPGFSWANMNRDATFNSIKRANGTFFTAQTNQYLKMASIDKTFIFIAMFDEVDEGTAMFKISSSASTTPVESKFVHASIDGESLPSDYYLQLAGRFTESYRSKAGMSYTATTAAPTASNSGAKTSAYNEAFAGETKKQGKQNPVSKLAEKTKALTYFKV